MHSHTPIYQWLELKVRSIICYTERISSWLQRYLAHST